MKTKPENLHDLIAAAALADAAAADDARAVVAAYLDALAAARAYDAYRAAVAVADHDTEEPK